MLACNVVLGICVGKICCHLWKNFYGMKICGVVCHGSSGMSLSFCGMRNCVVKVCGMTWSGFYGSHDGCYSYIHGFVSGSRMTKPGPIFIIMVRMSGVTMMPRG